MLEKQVTVTSRVDGEQATAALLQCPDCLGLEMLAYLVGERRALHLQCTRCGGTYCHHEGECGIQLSELDHYPPHREKKPKGRR